MKAILRSVFLCMLMLSSAPALAIYKCESQGKTAYSDAPCPGGTMLDLSTVPPADATAAKRQVAEEKAAVKKIEHERRKREAREEKERQRAAHENASRQKRCGLLAKRKKWVDEDVAEATGKSVEKLRRKAQRVNEQLEAECGNNSSRQLTIS